MGLSEHLNGYWEIGRGEGSLLRGERSLLWGSVHHLCRIKINIMVMYDGI